MNLTPNPAGILAAFAIVLALIAIALALTI